MPHKDVTGLVDKLKTQKGIVIGAEGDPGRQPFLFDGKVEPLMQAITGYLDKPSQDRAQAERGLRAAAAPSAMVRGHDPVVPVRCGAHP